ncbi:hypothetical protein E1292_46090 [Nonomuraea deserti]|uniref:Uncharacterized protein n=1 Tax=Nonomuraea deserti TaxID=1848322 RepID=A0A4R4U9R6_9ACTN|nr:hypothetical protein [Nonomuraea deserti]TDC88111.1 hypothetical protein E1292_46090 [Nonomuraea deserti]
MNTTPEGVVGALQFAGEELQAGAGGAQLLGQDGEIEAAAEPFALVHHEGARDARRAAPRRTTHPVAPLEVRA